MKYQGVALLVLLCVNAARSSEEKLTKTFSKRGTAGVGDSASYNNYGHSFSGRPPSPSYTDFTTPSPYGIPHHLPTRVTVARPYHVFAPRPYSVNVPYGGPAPKPYPVSVPQSYPAYPSSPVYPTYPTFGAALAGIHEQWSQNKGFGAPANAYSSGFGASALQGYGLGGSAHVHPLAPPPSIYNPYAPNQNGFPSSAGKLSILAAGLAAHPEIALAAAAAQHKHSGNPSAYSGLPGGPTKAGVLAARLAAYPEIGLAAAAAQKHHGPHGAHTHDVIAAAALAAQHAHTGSDFIAQLAGTPPSYATLAAAAHLGYGAHPSAHINSYMGVPDYSSALHKFAALKVHGEYPDFHSFEHAAQRYARQSKN